MALCTLLFMPSIGRLWPLNIAVLASCHINSVFPIIPTLTRLTVFSQQYASISLCCMLIVRSEASTFGSTHNITCSGHLWKKSNGNINEPCNTLDFDC